MLRGNRLSESIGTTNRESFFSTSARSEPFSSGRAYFAQNLQRPFGGLERLDFAREPSFSEVKLSASNGNGNGSGGGGVGGGGGSKGARPLPAVPDVRSKEGGGGVSLQQIIEGRTCSPASLVELKEFLRLVDQSGGNRMSSALEFVMTVQEYQRQFEALSPKEQERSPSPFEVISQILEAQRETRETLLDDESQQLTLPVKVNKPLPSLPPPSPNPFLDPPPMKFTFVNASDGSGGASLRANSGLPDLNHLSISSAIDGYSGTPIFVRYPSDIPGSLSPTINPRSSTGAASGESHMDPDIMRAAAEAAFGEIPRPALPPVPSKGLPTHLPPIRRRSTSQRGRGNALSLGASLYSTNTASSFYTILPPTIDPPFQPLRATLTAVMERYLSPFSPSTLERDLPPQLLSQAMLESKYTTHPGVLAPLCSHFYHLLNDDVIPAFLSSASQNLSSSTSRGRLMVSILATLLTIALVILLTLSPSPLTANRSSVPRVFRLLCLPLLVVAVGYALAAKTRLCFWLVLRGVREETKLETMMGGAKESKIASALGFARRTTDVKDAVVKSEQKRLTAVAAFIFVGVTAGLQVMILFLPSWHG